MLFVAVLLFAAGLAFLVSGVKDVSLSGLLHGQWKSRSG